jgi:hypothetical protein
MECFGLWFLLLRAFFSICNRCNGLTVRLSSFIKYGRTVQMMFMVSGTLEALILSRMYTSSAQSHSILRGLFQL